MNNLLLLVPESVCDSLADVTDAKVMSWPSQSAESPAWPSVTDVQKHATGFSHAAISASSSETLIRGMLGQLCDKWSDFSTAVVFSDEPLPSEFQMALPESLLPFLRRPQPRDLFVVSAGVLASTKAGSLINLLLKPGMMSMALPGQPAIDRFPLPGPGCGPPGLDLTELKSAIGMALDVLQPGPLDRRCMESGVLLLWDFLDESHQISQTMEGKGSPRTGDYWHGIMHRREPDAENASYWFRRVGRHPAFEKLGSRLIDWMTELGASAKQKEFVRSKLLSDGSLDPFALIQLSERALVYPDSEENLTCRMVQYLEMLNLLAWSSSAGAATF